jgi:hypothetical protein
METCPWIWLGGDGRCWLVWVVGGLGWPRAGVDVMWCLCCNVVVGGPFAGDLQLVFQYSLLLLVRRDTAWPGLLWRADVSVGFLLTGPVAEGVRVYSSVGHL